MKIKTVAFRRHPFGVRGFRRPSPALLAGLALMAGTTFVLHAQLTNIEKAVLLSWPEPAQEHIVLGSNSLASNAVWTPWPEPIFKRFGELCMTVPTVATQQFFKLVPGRQFADDFSESWGPFTNRNSWVEWVDDPVGEQWIVTNGVLRLDWNAPSGIPGFALFPLGVTNAEAVLGDVYMSVDMLDCVTSGTNFAVFALAARFTLDEGGEKAYLGALYVNYHGLPGVVQPVMYNGSNYKYGAPINIQQYPPPYRLQFSAVGTKLSLRVLHLSTGQFMGDAVNMPSSLYPTGKAALFISGRANPDDSFTITADNFFLTGKP